jgi:DNA helicase IV
VLAPIRAVERSQIPGGQYQAVMIDEGDDSFESLSIRAQGRTTIMRINYRTTRQMAVLCADWATMYLCASALAQGKLPHRARKRRSDHHPGAEDIQVMTMKVSKGLEFPVVALPGVGHMPAPGEGETEAARMFYVAATRATHKLFIAASGDGVFGQKLA